MTQSISNIQTLGANGNQTFRDMLGIAASVLCAIHCAAMPFVVSFLPLLGLSFLADPSFHKWMVGVCLVFALLAFVPGWRRHNRLQPAIIGFCGLALISFAAFAGPDECCPTPCAASTAPTDTACAAACCDSEGTDASAPAAAVLVSDAVDDETSCAASCCAGDETEATAPVAAVLVSEDVVEVDAQAPCAASCCSAEESKTSAPAVAALVSDQADAEAPCTEACCPQEDSTLLTAGTGEFMSMVWLLMTPIGGVILVTAHLVNHRLGCRCKAGCCD